MISSLHGIWTSWTHHRDLCLFLDPTIILIGANDSKAIFKYSQCLIQDSWSDPNPKLLSFLTKSALLSGRPIIFRFKSTWLKFGN